jgi:hypothetical protein
MELEPDFGVRFVFERGFAPAVAAKVSGRVSQKALALDLELDVAGPPLNGVWMSDLRTSHISLHTSLTDRPIAQGCRFAPQRENTLAQARRCVGIELSTDY